MAKRAAGSTRNTLPVGRVTGASRCAGGAGAKKPARKCWQSRRAWRARSQPSWKAPGRSCRCEHPGERARDGGRILGVPEVEQLVHPPDRRHRAAAHGAVGPDTRGELLPRAAPPAADRRGAAGRAPAGRAAPAGSLRCRRRAPVARSPSALMRRPAARRAVRRPPPSGAREGRRVRGRSDPLARPAAARWTRPFAQRADQAEHQPPCPGAQAAEPERAEQGEQQRLAQEDPGTAQLPVPAAVPSARPDQLPEEQPDHHGDPAPEQAAQGHRPLTSGRGCCRARACGLGSSPARSRGCCGCRRAGPGSSTTRSATLPGAMRPSESTRRSSAPLRVAALIASLGREPGRRPAAPSRGARRIPGSASGSPRRCPRRSARPSRGRSGESGPAPRRDRRNAAKSAGVQPARAIMSGTFHRRCSSSGTAAQHRVAQHRRDRPAG